MRTALFAGLSISVQLCALSSVLLSTQARAANKQTPNRRSTRGVVGVIDALRSTQNKRCSELADRLEALPMTKASYDLHLRHADLSPDDAITIAAGLARTSSIDQKKLRSLSMSYNDALNDSSIVSLIASFPESVTEVGLVACGLGDKSGLALLQWAADAPNLQMICVERNQFSSGVRSEFYEFARRRSDLLVTV